MFIPKSVLCLRGYSFNQFRGDISAGLVVGLVALPLAMAFAIASGLPPERGLYTAIVAGFIISLLSGSKVQIGGPTGAFVVIVSGIVAKFGYNGLALATLMAGVFLLIMGFTQMGNMVKFIPYPVTTGFTSGIAVIIFSSQIKDFFGLNIGNVPAEFVPKWMSYFKAFPTLNFWSLGVALFTTLSIIYWPKRWQRIPGSVIAIFLASLFVYTFNIPVDTIQSRFGSVPSGLPHPAIPHLSLEEIKLVSSSALTIAILAAIESLLSAVVADSMINGRHKSNMELVAQGAANLVSPLFGGIPATGAIARTATNVKNGGRTPVAGMIHAIVLFLILLVAGSWAAKIPLACLAGVLVVVSYHMSEWRSFRFMLSAPKSDIAVLLFTFFLTVFIDLTVAVEVGMVLSAFLFMKNMADLTQVRSISKELQINENISDESSSSKTKIPEGVELFSVHGSLFFGAANKLIEMIRLMSKKPKIVLLDLSDALHMDASGLHVIDQIHRECKTSGIRLIFIGTHAQPLIIMQQMNKFEEFGKENFKENIEEALFVTQSVNRV